MKKRTLNLRLLLISLTVVGALVPLLFAQKAQIRSTDKFQQAWATDRIVVKLRHALKKVDLEPTQGLMHTGLQSLDVLNARYRIQQIQRLFPDAAQNTIAAASQGLARIYRFKFAPTTDLQSILTAYAADPHVEYAQPVGIHRVYGVTPNDSYYSQQWGLPKMQAPDAWAINQGDSSVLLAIIDTGVDWQHPDLGGAAPFTQGNIWTNWAEYHGLPGQDDDGNGYVDDFRGWDFVDAVNSSYPAYPGEDDLTPDNNPMDFNGHGTHCAGIASALTNNRTGVAGLGWGCRLMPLRVGWSIDYSGYEIGLVSMDFCAQAIYYAANNGAKAINCSWGSSNSGGIADAVSYATARGVVVVTSAGNDDESSTSYLCSREDCFAVAATEPADQKASYSSYGYWVDLAAPGGDEPPSSHLIYSTYYDHATTSHTYAWLNGTSMAAPQVVGLTGLIQSQFSGLGWQDVKDRLQLTADDIASQNPSYAPGLLGAGRINAWRALTEVTLPAQDLIFQENFDQGLPTTWAAEAGWFDNDPGNRNQDFDDTYVAGEIRAGYDVWDPPFMIIDSDNAGDVPLDASLVSPIIDGSRYADLKLVFNNWFQNYYDSSIEIGDVDIQINNGPWENFARFTARTDYNSVEAARAIVIPLPNKADYSQIRLRWHYYNANYDWFWGIDNVRLSGTGLTTSPAVKILPSSQSGRTEAGKTKVFQFTIKNIGLNAENFQLLVTDQRWSTTIWNSTGTIPLTETGVLSSLAHCNIQVQVEAPPTAMVGAADTTTLHAISVTNTTISARAVIITTVINPPQKAPWQDTFLTTQLDPEKWVVNFGAATVDSFGIGEPSAPYSLRLNGDSSGGDDVQSNYLDLSADSILSLSFYYQRTGGGNSPEVGDDLWVDYFKADGTWENLAQYPGDGPDMTTYSQVQMLLPTAAYHNSFQLRFRSSGTLGVYDDWFIDDVFIRPPARISISPTAYQVTLAEGDSLQAAPLIVRNPGNSNLLYQITVLPHSDSTSNFMAQPAAYPPDYYAPADRKGRLDTRIGRPVIMGMGGPDTYGYFWYDSDSPSGPHFNWIDITATGIKIPGLSDDSGVGPYPLGFKFPFYDLNPAHFYLCSNGFINFSSHFTENSHKPIPNTDLPYLIAPYWTDLVIDSTAAVYYLFDGEKCIIEWYQARQYGSHNRFTFEILLYPNGTIIFQYLTMKTPNTNASIGIQNGDGVAGLGIAFNTVYVHDQLAIRIANSLDWLKVGPPTRGVVLPDSFVTIPVQFFANQNSEKNHFAADMIINSSGYLTPRLVVPVEMTVRINARIAGRIFAATTPLAGVTVQAWENYPAGLPIQTTVTNTQGNYAFLLPPELRQCDVRAFLKGYWPVVKSQVPVNQTAVHLNLTAIPPVTSTPEWVHFVSLHTRFWGEPVQPGDVITAADPDGIMCGSFTVVTPGAYGILLAYADDATTPQIDEGAQPGDTLTFFINGIAATVSSPEAPVFTMPGDLHQVDLEVGKMAVQNIPLNAGWNLVSWHLDTPDDEGTHLFHRIFSNLIVITGFDGVSQVFDPRHPQLSTLKYLDHRHGYWIKVTQTCELPIWGQPLDVARVPIPCRRGYNLISYLPDAPDSLTHALASVNAHLVRVMGYENGGLVYDPAWPAFNSLHILQPNFGYWLWLAEKDSLWYPRSTASLPGHLNQADFITGSDFQKSKLTAVNATPEWIYVMAGGTQIYPELLPVGSHLQAIDPQGIICGDYAVTQPGQLGFMAIYRDDPRTELDEGAEPGDLIHFSINEKSLPFTTTWTKFGDIIDLAPELTAVTQTDAMPTTYALLQNYPNPFNPTTIIKFQIPEASIVNLKILNLLGEEVRTLLLAPRPPGQYQIIWDGCDNQGNLLATGVYFYTLKTTHFQQTKKLVRIK